MSKVVVSSKVHYVNVRSADYTISGIPTKERRLKKRRRLSEVQVDAMVGAGPEPVDSVPVAS